jgi:hypothetical protein
MRSAGHVARTGERRGVYSDSVLRPEGRRLLERPRRKWDENIKMDIQMGWEASTGLIWLKTGTGDGHL